MENTKKWREAKNSRRINLSRRINAKANKKKN